MNRNLAGSLDGLDGTDTTCRANPTRSLGRVLLMGKSKLTSAELTTVRRTQRS